MLVHIVQLMYRNWNASNKNKVTSNHSEKLPNNWLFFFFNHGLFISQERVIDIGKYI